MVIFPKLQQVGFSNQINSYYLYKLLGESFYLLPEKAVFWKEKRTLIISDLHLGKAAHFRKSGIQVPESVHISDYIRIKKLLVKFNPEQTLILGDLFHSEFNSEWQRFSAWIQSQNKIHFVLIKGNHDILPQELYRIANLQVYQDSYDIHPFTFIHRLADSIPNFTICGHTHPAVKMYGSAKQTVTLPCYYFTKMYGILPAFGNFTGYARIKPEENDDIFVILENSVIKM